MNVAAVVRTVVPVDLDQVYNCKDFCRLNRLLRVTARVLRFLEMGRGLVWLLVVSFVKVLPMHLRTVAVL